MPERLNYKTAQEFTIALENELGFYRVGWDGPIPQMPQSRIYQIKLFCPSIQRTKPIIISSTPSPVGWECHERELPQEDASVILTMDGGQVGVVSEWYGVDLGDDLIRKYGAYEMGNKIKTGDFSYEITTLKNDTRILVVNHGTHTESSVINSLDPIARLLHEVFAFYEVPGATREWRKRVDRISRLRRIKETIGDPNRLFRVSQRDFEKTIEGVSEEFRRFI